MAVATHIRRWALVVGVLVVSSASAGDVAYLQLPGFAGPTSGPRYSGWFEVTQNTVVLAPGSYGADTSSVTPNCTAMIRTRLASAGAAVAELVGAPVGNVKLERVAGPGESPYYQAVLRNAVLTQHGSGFEAGVAYDVLWLRFDSIEVTTYEVKSDGTRGSGTQGHFSCLAAR
jgi:hypothetical protein